MPYGINRTIIFATFHLPPWSFVIFDKNGHVTDAVGKLPDMTKHIIKHMQLNISFILPTDGEYGIYLPNNNSKGMLGQVERGEADGTSAALAISLGLHEGFHLTPYSTASPNMMLTGMKKAYYNQNGAFYDTFDEWTWILLAISAVVVSTTFAFHQYVKYRHFSWQDLSDILTKIFQTVFQEGTKNRFDDTFTYILGGSLILATMILMQMYQSNSKVNMVVERPTFRLDSMDQLLNKAKGYTIYFAISSPMEQRIMEMSDKTGEQLRERIAQDPSGRTLPTEMFSPRVQTALLERKGVLFMESVAITATVRQWCMQTKGYFYMNRGDSKFETFLITSAFRRNLPPEFLKRFDMSVSWLNAFGVQFDLPEVIYTGHMNCVPGKSSRQVFTAHKLNIQDIAFNMTILGTMLAVALTALVLEIFFHKFVTSR